MGMSLTELLAHRQRQRTQRIRARQPTRRTRLRERGQTRRNRQQQRTERQGNRQEGRSIRQGNRQETRQTRIEYGVDAGSIATGVLTGQPMERPDLPSGGDGGGHMVVTGDTGGGMSPSMMLGAAGLGLGLIGLLATQGGKKR